MRNMNTIREELGKAIAEYQANESRPLSDRIKALQKELQLAISEGAKDCPKCGNHPIGLRHVVGVGRTGEWYHTYEIGCCGIKAKASTPPEDSGADLAQHDEAARAKAVAKWNVL